jgi:hypothetical protein
MVSQAPGILVHATRNVGWFKANPWFEAEVLPVLRERVHALLAAPCVRA